MLVLLFYLKKKDFSPAIRVGDCFIKFYSWKDFFSLKYYAGKQNTHTKKRVDKLLGKVKSLYRNINSKAFGNRFKKIYYYRSMFFVFFYQQNEFNEEWTI